MSVIPEDPETHIMQSKHVIWNDIKRVKGMIKFKIENSYYINPLMRCTYLMHLWIWVYHFMKGTNGSKWELCHSRGAYSSALKWLHAVW